MLRQIDHFIGGSAVAAGDRSGEVFNPSAGEVQASVRLGTAADLQKAIDAANAALPGWAATNPQRRARVMFEFKRVVEANLDELAHLLSSEHGKVLSDAEGEITRAITITVSGASAAAVAAVQAAGGTITLLVPPKDQGEGAAPAASE